MPLERNKRQQAPSELITPELIKKAGLGNLEELAVSIFRMHIESPGDEQHLSRLYAVQYGLSYALQEKEAQHSSFFRILSKVLESSQPFQHKFATALSLVRQAIEHTPSLTRRLKDYRVLFNHIWDRYTSSFRSEYEDENSTVFNSIMATKSFVVETAIRQLLEEGLPDKADELYIKNEYTDWRAIRGDAVITNPKSLYIDMVRSFLNKGDTNGAQNFTRRISPRFRKERLRAYLMLYQYTHDSRHMLNARAIAKEMNKKNEFTDRKERPKKEYLATFFETWQSILFASSGERSDIQTAQASLGSMIKDMPPAALPKAFQTLFEYEGTDHMILFDFIRSSLSTLADDHTAIRLNVLLIKEQLTPKKTDVLIFRARLQTFISDIESSPILLERESLRAIAITLEDCLSVFHTCSFLRNEIDKRLVQKIVTQLKRIEASQAAPQLKQSPNLLKIKNLRNLYELETLSRHTILNDFSSAFSRFHFNNPNRSDSLFERYVFVLARSEWREVVLEGIRNLETRMSPSEPDLELTMKVLLTQLIRSLRSRQFNNKSDIRFALKLCKHFTPKWLISQHVDAQIRLDVALNVMRTSEADDLLKGINDNFERGKAVAKLGMRRMRLALCSGQ